MTWGHNRDATATSSLPAWEERPMPQEKHRILIVDDHAVLRAGLQAIIESTDDLTVCGEAVNAQEALDTVEKLEPDLAIVDISLKNSIDGIELTRRLKKRVPAMPVLVLSMHEGQKYIDNAVAAGARGYITKTED